MVLSMPRTLTAAGQRAVMHRLSSKIEAKVRSLVFGAVRTKPINIDIGGLQLAASAGPLEVYITVLESFPH
jgi:hypothetical protein